MGNENGTWIMRGLPADDPKCIRTPEQLLAYINEVGFLPLFRGDIPGFSVEEHTESMYWWSGDIARDPWEWRAILARGGEVAYGKFFDHKAGFVSKRWLPHFANYRRDGYDFDALWDDGKAQARQKRVMDLFDDTTELSSVEVKARAGFGGDGAKNFEGVMTALQMEAYLLVRDFRQRTNKNGAPYGWAISVFAKPEHLFGYDHMASAYRTDPAVSRKMIMAQIRDAFPGATERALLRV